MFKTYFLDVITKHYVDFSGRATRKQFWLYTLIISIITLVLYFLSSVDNIIGTLFTILSAIISFALLLPDLAIAVRRLHDINFSGWWVLVALVPGVCFSVLQYTSENALLLFTGAILALIGYLILLILCVLPTKETNHF